MPKVALVASDEIVHAGRNRRRKNGLILGYQRDIGWNELDIRVADKLSLREQALEPLIVADGFDIPRNLTDNILRDDDRYISEPP